MASPPNPQSRSDIGLISDTSSLGESGGTPASRAADASSKQARPDSGREETEPRDEQGLTDEQSHEANGAIAAVAESAAVAKENGAPQGPEKPTPPAPVISPNAGGADEPRGVGKPWPALDYSQKHDAVEAELLERMRAKYGTSLVQDMEDAQHLLSYVTRNGLQEDRKVSDSTIQTLISAREHMRSFTFDSQKEEATFRKSCGIIAKAAEPVTIASLRDSTTTQLRPSLLWCIAKLFQFRGIFELVPREPRRRYVAEIACLRYRRLAIVVLVILLFFQIYWTVTSSILKKTDALIAELAAQPNRDYYLEQEAARQKALAPTREPKPSAPPATTSTTPATSTQTNSPAPTATAPPALPAVDKSKLTLDQLLSKMGELRASYVMLHKAVFFVGASKLAAAHEEPNDTTESEPPKQAKDIFTPTDLQVETAKLRTVAEQMVDVLQKWVLPLLYGTLGAMVFVVRTLSVQARDRLFRREALVSLVLRVFLGMISGLAIGWFWNQSPGGATAAGALSATALSPFALAFVAGYGVELFFALLDKIVSTFTNK